MTNLEESDQLRSEYELTKLVRLPDARVHYRRRPKREPLELTSGFPGFEEKPTPGFEWDPAKAVLNFSKHAVTFNEASTVFDNPLARETYDPDHSEAEERYLLIGHSARGQVLIVSYTDREDGTRIISARKALHRERKDYENGAIP